MSVLNLNSLSVPTLELTIKGKDEFCKGRRYKSSFAVVGQEEHLYDTIDGHYIYDFMAKFESEFKMAYKEQEEANATSLFEALLPLNRKEYKYEQGTSEWLVSRSLYLTSTSSFEKTTLNKIVASRIARKLSKYPQFSELSESILSDVVSVDGFTSSDMERGNELEKVAIAQFEKEYGIKVESNNGLVVFNDKEFNLLGSSIDGKCIIDGKKICLEIKSPSYPKFLDKYNYKNYIQQCTIHKIVGGFDKVLLVEYYMGHKLKVTEVDISKTRMNEVIEKSIKMNNEANRLVDEKIEELLEF